MADKVKITKPSHMENTFKRVFGEDYLSSKDVNGMPYVLVGNPEQEIIIIDEDKVKSWPTK